MIALLVEARGYSAGFPATAGTVTLGLLTFLTAERRRRHGPRHAALAD